MSGQPAYGWYGKIPGHGDFIQQGLSAGFVTAWDRWMQHLLLAGRDALGARWDACYCRAPIWRFAVAPEACGPGAAAGVMMPSVDRVGRHFPLCLAAERQTSLWGAYAALRHGFADLEEAALAMLEDEATQGHLEARLSALRPADIAGRVAQASVGPATALHVEGGVEDGLAALAAGAAAALWVAEVGGRQRILLSPFHSDGKAEAAALFDADALCWTATT